MKHLRIAVAPVALLLALCPSPQAAEAGSAGELAIKRQGVFEFTAKPKVTRKGDRITIAFASKAYCDATVAIENSEGKIIRHLACGVLGKNAPAPFAKNSRKQTLIWDGKDDRGRYVDDKDSHSVRVSLGLKARFERTLYWSPERRATSYKYAGRNSPAIFATSAGVYVHDNNGGDDHLRLFGRDGHYARTIYPFPADKVKKALGLKWTSFPPDGLKTPYKTDRAQTTMITAGGGKQKVLAVHKERIALIGERVNWLATDGSTGGRQLTGPAVTFPVAMGRVHSFAGGVYQFGPRSAVFSPDGKWLYLTGYRWGNPWREGILPGVARLAVSDGKKVEVFLGNMKKKGGEGKAPGSFRSPTSVDVDSKGRLYVSDYHNDRVQIFSPEGKHLKSISVTRPALVKVQPKSGEIFVFTWSMASCYYPALEHRGESRLTVFGSFDSPKKKAEYSLAVSREWAIKRAAIDAWSKPLRVWIADSHVRVYELGRGKLKLVKSFQEAAKKQALRPVAPRHGRQRLYFNPATRKLYVGFHQDPAVIHAKGFYKMTRIDPETGKLKFIHLPFDCEDMAFGPDGLAYLRTQDFIARYDSRLWREVPFDYGEERRTTYYQGFRKAKVMSGLVAAAGGNSSLQFGGMAVSPKGNLVVTFYNPNKPVDRRKTKGVHAVPVQKYTPKIYPGRSVQCLVHVWDRHGKLLYEDAVKGVGRTSSVAMDRDDNLYLLANAQTKHGGKLYPNPSTCTLIKVRPGTRVRAVGKMPVPLPPAARPKRTPEIARWFGSGLPVWIEKPEWVFGGVGLDGKRYAKCHCTATSQMGLDYFGRSFVGETQRCDLVVIDSAGNAILRIGRYGNVDDGLPLVKKGGPANPRSIGGDEVSFFNPKFVAVDTDRRAFVADIGNYRIVSIKLEYGANARVALKNVPDDDKRKGATQ
jgi:DNA-binding beta-propeller fold protein YncE